MSNQKDVKTPSLEQTHLTLGRGEDKHMKHETPESQLAGLFNSTLWAWHCGLLARVFALRDPWRPILVQWLTQCDKPLVISTTRGKNWQTGL
jgi:hypothetical protein